MTGITRLKRFPPAMAVLLALAGCASANNPAAGPGACAYDAASRTLSITGSIDDQLAHCIIAHENRDVMILRVDSVGGQVNAALDAADAIARWRPHIVVAGQCNSSCANYWLPVAGRITLEPRAAVILHGSIDQGFVDRLPPERRASSQATADRQAAFVDAHGVSPGWLLTRTREDFEAGRLGDHLTGAPAGNGPLFRGIRYLLVEERFMRSCLAGPEIDPFENTAPQRVRDHPLNRLLMAWQGIALSETLECA